MSAGSARSIVGVSGTRTGQCRRVEDVGGAMGGVGSPVVGLGNWVPTDWTPAEGLSRSSAPRQRLWLSPMGVSAASPAWAQSFAKNALAVGIVWAGERMWRALRAVLHGRARSVQQRKTSGGLGDIVSGLIHCGPTSGSSVTSRGTAELRRSVTWRTSREGCPARLRQTVYSLFDSPSGRKP